MLATGQTAAAAPPNATTGAVEHPSPRAELVPPGDRARGADGEENLPVLPAVLLAIALPALAVVLLSAF